MPNDAADRYHFACHAADVLPGGSRMIVIGDTMIGIFNVGGRFFALANECPHAGASLAHGIVEGDTVRCRIHHWRFSIPDGACLEEGKSQSHAGTFPVRVVGDDVQVAVDLDGPATER